MAVITNQILMEIDDVQELVDFLSENFFKKDNLNLCWKKDIDEYIKITVSIIKFDIHNYSNSLFFTENNPYRSFRSFSDEEKEWIINAFEKIGNKEIADLLKLLFDLTMELIKPILGNLDPWEYVKNIEYYKKLLEPEWEEHMRKYSRFRKLKSDFEKLYDSENILKNVKNYIKTQRKDL